jgi:stage III sporulation protein AG
MEENRSFTQAKESFLAKQKDGKARRGGTGGKPKLTLQHKIILAAGLLGILLLCISVFSSDAGKKSGVATGGTQITVDMSAYEANMEKRLTDLVRSMAGAGETKVMLTLECGGEPVYATQGTSEQKSASSGDTAEESITAEKNYVIVGSGAAAQGLVLKTLEPKIRGAVILCEGADDIQIKQMITDAVTRVLDLGANKISVARLRVSN